MVLLKITPGTSLVVQWLRLCAPSTGGPGSIPGQETRVCMPQLRPSTAKQINRYFKKKLWDRNNIAEGRLQSASQSGLKDIPN